MAKSDAPDTTTRALRIFIKGFTLLFSPGLVNPLSDRVHPVWFIRDTAIRDMVEFPKQTKEHVVIETICSNTAKGQSSFKNPRFCTVSIQCHDELADLTLWTSPYWSQLWYYSFFLFSM